MKSLETINREGLDALRERLGRAGMVRFLQQFGTGQGDYTKARQRWADKVSFADIRLGLKKNRRKNLLSGK